MKLSKFVCFIGGLYLLMQFLTVKLYSDILSISREQGLPVDDLAQIQTWIMKVVLFSLIAFGVLFLSLLVVVTIKRRGEVHETIHETIG